MWTSTLIAARTAVVTLVLTGLAYPALVAGLAQVLFRADANGNLVTDSSGRIVGSALIGQDFSSPAYFHPRPSAAGSNGYDATASGGSNLGPTSEKLRTRVSEAIATLRRANPDGPLPIPADLVTASASGLDPHLSPAAALWQVARVARVRGLAADRVQTLVDAQIEGRDLGFLGEPRVNVLLLNLALDRQFGAPTGGHDDRTPR